MKTEKKFDSVRAMREIRDAINHEIQGMSFEQQRDYIRKHLKPREDDGDNSNERGFN